MAITQQDFAKLMSPMKKALLGLFVSLSPGTLDQASAKALNQAVEQTVQNLAKETAENEQQKAVEEAIQNFGPDKAPETGEQGGLGAQAQEGENFPEGAKNDILPGNNTPPAIPAPATKAVSPDATPSPESNQTPPTQDQAEAEQGKMAAQGGPEQPSPEEGGEKQEEKLSPEEMEKLKEEEEQRKQQEAEAKLPREKSGITQGINGLINRSRIKNLEKQIKKLGSDLKTWDRLMARQKKTLSRVEKQKNRLDKMKKRVDGIRKVLKFFNWTLGLVILGFLLVFTVPWKKSLDAASERLKGLIEPLEERIKTIKEAIKVLEKQIKTVQNKIRELTMQIYKLYNEESLVGLVSGAAKRISSKK